jgi:hypothetical protein
MRNLFDQYNQPENRLTHALVSALAEDEKLLRQFIRWITGKSPTKPHKLVVLEQRLPGEPEITVEESERRGLPDGWIHDNDECALLIESKVAVSLKSDQLLRHQRTAIRRGFNDINILAIDVIVPRKKLPDGVVFKKWSEIYEWLTSKSKDSEWAGRVANYLEVAETKLSADGYLKEGTITVFSGVPFDAEEPYNYPEAKNINGVRYEITSKMSSMKNEIYLCARSSQPAAS